MASTDGYYGFVDPQRHISAAVAFTTDLVQTARELHRCARTSCIALGRVLTAVGLTGMTHRDGPVSFQIIGDGHLGQVYADVTPDGWLRGFLRNPTLAMSLSGVASGPRHSIAAAVGTGVLSVIRQGTGREFSQSTVELVSGELDTDVEAYLNNSDQVETVLVCDVLMSEAQVLRAGGLMLQALPEAEANSVLHLRETITSRFAHLLLEGERSPLDIVREFLPQARPTETLPLSWRCRCSYARAMSGLKMLGPEELAKMVDDRENAEISCDFCGKNYVVGPEDVEKMFLETITARG